MAARGIISVAGACLALLALNGCATPQSTMDEALEEARSERESASENTSRQHDDAMDRMERRRQQE